MCYRLQQRAFIVMGHFDESLHSHCPLPASTRKIAGCLQLEPMRCSLPAPRTAQSGGTCRPQVCPGLQVVGGLFNTLVLHRLSLYGVITPHSSQTPASSVALHLPLDSLVVTGRSFRLIGPGCIRVNAILDDPAKHVAEVATCKSGELKKGRCFQSCAARWPSQGLRGMQ